MRNWLLIFSFFMFFLCVNKVYTASASDSCIPAPIKIENNEIILLGNPLPKTTQIYFFKNKSSQSVFIDHSVANPGASAGWSSYLRPENWSAITLNKKNFAVRCVMIQPGKLVTLNCSHTITICTPKNVETKTKLKGSYWLAEDKNWEGLVKALEKRGITFKSSER